jgi:hypothetical protein
MMGGRRAGWTVLSVMAAIVLIAPPLASGRAQESAMASAQAPSCVVGTWTASDLQPALEAFTEGVTEGLGIEQLDGEFILTVQPEGAYQAQYNNISFSAAVGGMSVSGTLVGSVNGTYREESPGMLAGTITDGTVNVTLSVFGQVMSTAFPIPAQDNVLTAYECDGDQLTLSITNPYNGSISTVVLTRSA